MSAIRSRAAPAWSANLIADIDGKMTRGAQAPGARELAAAF